MSTPLGKWKELSDSEQEKLLKAGINKLLNRRYRDKLASKLSKEYQISRQTTRKRDTKVKWLRPLAIAASILILITAGNILLNKQSLSDFAFEMIHQDYLQHPGFNKGAGQTDETRTSGVEAFVNREFSEAATLFESINEKNEEDRFYLALSLLYSADYLSAINQFKEIQKNSDNRFRQETNWFLSLALIQNDQLEEASTILGEIGLDEWHHEDAQELLKKIP